MQQPNEGLGALWIPIIMGSFLGLLFTYGLIQTNWHYFRRLWLRMRKKHTALMEMQEETRVNRAKEDARIKALQDVFNGHMTWVYDQVRRRASEGHRDAIVRIATPEIEKYRNDIFYTLRGEGFEVDWKDNYHLEVRW